MFEFLKNKRLINIATNTIVLVGIIFYFSKENKKTTDRLDSLEIRSDEAVDRLQSVESSVDYHRKHPRRTRY